MLEFLKPKWKRYILIDREVCRRFDEIVRECMGRDERGGILIGGRRGPHIDVTKMTFPDFADKSEQFRFERSNEGHQQAAERAWETTEGTLSYVGEWHSHPYGAIEPSGVDLATWRTVARQQGERCAFVLVTPEGWGVFTASNSKRSVRRLRQLESGLTGLVFGVKLRFATVRFKALVVSLEL